MRVTCELWAYIEQYGGKLMSNRQAEELATIAEHIDQAHESAMYDMRREHDEWVADRDANYTMLPLDADGMPIRVGDVVEWCDSGDTLTVEGIGKDILFYIENEGAEWTAARNKRHHEPTVEDVLRDFGVDIAHALDADPDATVPETIIAEYAAKLRLAGDAE